MRKDKTVITQVDVWFGNCDELREKYKIPDTVQCCGSCHQDAEEGYCRMPEHYENEDVYVCCCKVQSFVEDAL